MQLEGFSIASTVRLVRLWTAKEKNLSCSPGDRYPLRNGFPRWMRRSLPQRGADLLMSLDTKSFLERWISTSACGQAAGGGRPPGRGGPEDLARLVRRGWLTPSRPTARCKGGPPNWCWASTSCRSSWARAAWDRSYRAWHRRLDRLVALKLHPPAAAGKPRAVERFCASASGRPPVASQHRPGPRCRRDRRHSLPGHGAGRGDRPGAGWCSTQGRLPVAAGVRLRSPGGAWACSTCTRRAWSTATSSRKTCC